MNAHRNFLGASNFLWGLGQPNSDLVGLTKMLVWRTLIFDQANQKMMRIEATKFLVSATKFLVGAAKFLFNTTLKKI